jgi:hypothetical protein
MVVTYSENQANSPLIKTEIICAVDHAQQRLSFTHDQRLLCQGTHFNGRDTQRAARVCRKALS